MDGSGDGIRFFPTGERNRNDIWYISSSELVNLDGTVRLCLVYKPLLILYPV